MFEAEKQGEVVVTGAGLVTPLGSSAESFYESLRRGQSAIARGSIPEKGLTRGMLSGALREPMVARIGDFGAAAAIEAGRRRRMPRLGQFCVVAAQQALGCAPTDSAIPKTSPAIEHYGRERIGIVLGTGLGALDTTLEFTAQYIENGLGAGSPALFPYTVMNTAAALVAMEFQLFGPNLTVNHRDLSLVESLASACDLLRCGHLDAVLAGGGDELGEWLLHIYSRLGVLSADGDMQPYARVSHGFSPGEGAALFLLERADGAKARGARILARLSGLGRAGDDRPRIGWQRPFTDPAQHVIGAADAVRQSLASAALDPADIDFIAGSGNGTELDAIETLALQNSLGAAAKTVPIASILGQSGEWMTSAGVRLFAGLYALSEQALPGTRCADPDPQKSLPGLVLSPRPASRPVRHVLVPTFAQGGGNVSLILSAA